MASSTTRLSLAFRNLESVPVDQINAMHPHLKELDLTGNQLREFSCIRAFPELLILVLDENIVTSDTKFPGLPKLHTLWVNHNDIRNLPLFLDKVVISFPAIRHLSMLKNEACPSYFNGGTSKLYKDYRVYTLSRLPSLQSLDNVEITEEERSLAKTLYKPAATVGAPTRVSSQTPTKPKPAKVDASTSSETKKVSKQKKAGEDDSWSDSSDWTDDDEIKPV